MNREPLDFENIQFLVDGVHFAGQKKSRNKIILARKRTNAFCSRTFGKATSPKKLPQFHEITNCIFRNSEFKKHEETVV